jgi:hypothetical protein
VTSEDQFPDLKVQHSTVVMKNDENKPWTWINICKHERCLSHISCLKVGDLENPIRTARNLWPQRISKALRGSVGHSHFQLLDNHPSWQLAGNGWELLGGSPHLVAGKESWL